MAEGAADVATAVGQGARQTAAVERTKCVRAKETKNKTFNILETSTSKTTAADKIMQINSHYLYKCLRFGPSSVLKKYLH